METTNKTASEILLEAANILEQEGKWNKGSYFQSDASVGCKMCAHGAIAFCGNPKIKSLVLNNIYTGARELASISSPICSLGDEYYTYLAQKENLTVEQYIAKRFGGVGLAHYKAWKVGLTYYFNDLCTTKQDVINKLREAATI